MQNRMDLIMRHSFFHRMQWFLLIGSLFGLWGCVNMMEAIPTPPAFLAPVQLNGPYDADIPTRETNQIKRASLVQNGAVPYIFISVGAHFESEGDSVRSIHFFNRAIEEFRKRNNAFGEGTAFSRKIAALERYGHVETAGLCIRDMEKKWPGAPLNAFIFYNYGYHYLQKGDYSEARKYFGQALAANSNSSDNPDLLALRRDTELGYGKALVLAEYFPKVAGLLFLMDFDETFYQDIRRNISEGLSHLQQVEVLNNDILKTNVIQYFPEITPLFIECDVRNFMGLAYGIQGQFSEGVKNLEAAIRIAQKNGYRLSEVDSLFFLNQLYLLEHDVRKGKKTALDLETMADKYQLSSYAIWARVMLAHHARRIGDIDQAINSLNEALTLMERNALWLLNVADFRGIAFFKRQDLYEALLELQAGKTDERGAFETAERSKTALLADLLANEMIGKNPLASASVKQIHFYREQMAGDYLRLLSPASGSAVFMNTVARIDKIRRAYADELAGIKEKDGALYSLIGVVPSNAGEIQRLLDNNTTLFTYYVGAKYLYIWVISKNGFHQEKIRMSRREVDWLVHSYRSAMISKDKSQANALSEKVYDAFLKPVIPFVYGDRVGFVPHGALCNLSFASMRYIKSYLVDGFTIFYLPHAGMINPMLSENLMPKTKKVLIFADPQCIEKQQPVRRAGQEMEMLKKIFPQADYYVAANTSRANMQKSTGIYDIIHFASDCYLMKETVLDSGLLLPATGQHSGCLNVRDIVRLQFTGRMTVLNDCRTERGVSSTDAGMLSLVNAWLYAVSPSVVTSLWRVEEKSKAAWVGMFYKNLEKSGNIAEALQAAQNEMIQKGYGPSEWAAFKLTGRN